MNARPIRPLLFSTILFVLSAVPALADTPSQPKVYNGISMEDLGETLLLEGLRFTQVPIDGKGMVANQRFDVSDGVEWSILGYACEGADGCSELQMRAVFQAKDEAHKMLPLLNHWNATNRFTRAYIINGSNVILEMDVYLSGGQSLKNIRNQITIWRQSVRSFSTSLTPPDDAP